MGYTYDEVMDYMGKLSEAEIKTLSHNSIGNYLDTCYSLLLFDNAFKKIPDSGFILHPAYNLEKLIKCRKNSCG